MIDTVYIPKQKPTGHYYKAYDSIGVKMFVFDFHRVMKDDVHFYKYDVVSEYLVGEANVKGIEFYLEGLNSRIEKLIKLKQEASKQYERGS